MALIENLVVALGLRTKQFDSRIEKSKQKLSGFQKSTALVSAKMKALGVAALGAVAAFASFRSVISNISSAMDELDVLGKTSRKLGLATEQLTALRLAASEMAGMEFKTFDIALQRMVRRISEASKGKGEGLNAIKELGLDAKVLNAMSPENQLRAIADAFQAIGSSSDRIRLAMRLFDSEGVAMVNVLTGGAGALDAVFERASRLGILFSSLDISKVEAANDAWGEMKLAIGGAWQSLAIDLSPAIVVFSRKMVELIISTREWGSTFGSVAEFIVGAMGTIVDITVVLTTQFRLLSASLEMLGAIAGTIAGGGSLSDAMSQIDEILEKIKKVGLDLDKALSGGFHQEFLDELEKIRREFEDQLDSGNNQIDDTVASGSDRKLSAGALNMGTREAAVAAMNAGANDRNTELFRAGVVAVNDVRGSAIAIEAALREIAGDLGLPAGIVP